MEQINMHTMQIVDDLARMRSFRKANADKQPDTDPYGFKYEPFEAFSAEPLGFLETAMRLQTEALELFGAMGTANRHSPLYIRMCSQMEKLIAQLGSCCITKAVIEHEEGEKFGFLTDLTIKRLRKITGFNFRKCYQSFMESQTLGHFNAATLNLSVRWAALDKRLIATAEKIEKINAGKVKVDLSENKEAEKSETKASEKAEQNAEPASFAGKARSFSIDKAMVRQNTASKTDNVPPEETSVADASACEAAPCTYPVAGKETSVPETAAEKTVSVENPNPAPEGPSSEPNPAEHPDYGSPEQTESEELEPELPEAFPNEENIPYVSEALVRRMADFWSMQELIECAPP